MSSFLRWALREMRPALRGPELQESLDLRRALNCLAARGSSSSQSGPLDDNASLSLSQKRELVHTSVMAQLLQLLRAVAETDAGESARRRRHRHHPNDGSGPDPNAFPLNTAARAGGVSRTPSANVASDEYQDELQRLVGFAVRPAPSGAPGAGQGVWLNGRASIGSVVRTGQSADLNLRTAECFETRDHAPYTSVFLERNPPPFPLSRRR